MTLHQGSPILGTLAMIGIVALLFWAVCLVVQRFWLPQPGRLQWLDGDGMQHDGERPWEA